MKRLNVLTWLTLVALALTAARAPKYDVGDEVTDFTLKNVDGKMVSLSTYADKGAIVIFDCNTCPYSKIYNDRIIALHAKYAKAGFPVIAINPNDPKLSPGDSFEEMVKRAKKKSYEFPYLIDERQEVARAFGASNTPHVFVVKKEGDAFKVAYIGAIDNNSRNAESADKKYVEEAVDALLANKPVAVEKTKAIGCGVKYRRS